MTEERPDSISRPVSGLRSQQTDASIKPLASSEGILESLGAFLLREGIFLFL